MEKIEVLFLGIEDSSSHLEDQNISAREERAP